MNRLLQAGRRWLFLDYDGTLDDFAPTPDHVLPNPQVIDRVTCLSRQADTRLVVLSGRRLDHVLSLLPVPGVFLAGTYGIEIHLPDGQRLVRAAYDMLRPPLEAVKSRWAQLIAGRGGFYLEDKTWALALHARYAAAGEVDRVLDAARDITTNALSSGHFRLLGGNRFLEIAPAPADKGRTVEYILDRYAWPGAVPFYLGDDDKDEAAFKVINSRGGMTMLVAPQPRVTHAACRLESPGAARQWLGELCARLQRDSPA